MKRKKETPGIHRQGVLVQLTINFNGSSDKGTETFNISQTQRKILNLFLSGGKYSVVDICREITTADPRAHIRTLRNMGVKISDYWVKSPNSHYKVYFIE